METRTLIRRRKCSTNRRRLFIFFCCFPHSPPRLWISVDNCDSHCRCSSNCDQQVFTLQQLLSCPVASAFPSFEVKSSCILARRPSRHLQFTTLWRRNFSSSYLQPLLPACSPKGTTQLTKSTPCHIFELSAHPRGAYHFIPFLRFVRRLIKLKSNSSILTKSFYTTFKFVAIVSIPFIPNHFKRRHDALSSEATASELP